MGGWDAWPPGGEAGVVPTETSPLDPNNEEWQLATLSYNIEIP